jgi:uncharacterized protein (DUF433 family)
MTGPSLIEIRPDVMLGKPCLAGTRIPVSLIVEKLEAGETVDEIVASYGYITREQVLAARQYGAAGDAGFPAQP